MKDSNTFNARLERAKQKDTNRIDAPIIALAICERVIRLSYLYQVSVTFHPGSLADLCVRTISVIPVYLFIEALTMQDAACTKTHWMTFSET